MKKRLYTFAVFFSTLTLLFGLAGCQKLAEIREQLFTRVEEVKTQINETKTSIENKVEDVKNAAKEIQEAGEEVKEAFDAVDQVTGRSE